MLSGLTRWLARAPDPVPVPDAGPRLFTIGYQGYSRAACLRVLAAHSVTILCDVRRSAVSRDAAFGRLPLGRACAEAGIRYEHLWQLGAHSEGRRDRRARADQEFLLENFRLRTLPNQQARIGQIHDWLLAGHRVALACFERPADGCPRACVADELQRNFGETCRTIHL